MHILPYSWWRAYSRNFGRDDGNLNANALATGPSATTCRIFTQNLLSKEISSWVNSCEQIKWNVLKSNGPLCQILEADMLPR